VVSGTQQCQVPTAEDAKPHNCQPPRRLCLNTLSTVPWGLSPVCDGASVSTMRNYREDVLTSSLVCCQAERQASNPLWSQFWAGRRTPELASHKVLATKLESPPTSTGSVIPRRRHLALGLEPMSLP